MAEALTVITKRDGTIRISDGANNYDFALDMGDFNVDLPGESLVEILDRGKFVSPVPQTRKVDDQPMTGGFSGYFRDPGGSSDVTLMTFLTGGTPSGWTPTNGAAAEVPMWSLFWIFDNDGGAKAAEVEFPFTTLRGSVQEGETTTINATFISRAVDPTITFPA